MPDIKQHVSLCYVPAHDVAWYKPAHFNSIREVGGLDSCGNGRGARGISMRPECNETKPDATGAKHCQRVDQVRHLILFGERSGVEQDWRVSLGLRADIPVIHIDDRWDDMHSRRVVDAFRILPL